MTFPTNLFAYTAPSSGYPEYLSVNRTPDGAQVSITVRDPVKKASNTSLPYDMPGNTVCITLSREESKLFLQAMAAAKE